jgi:hypothetical protein
MGQPMIHCRLRQPTVGLTQIQIRRWIEGRGRPLNMQRREWSARITERLASRVKGLTAVFCVLLLPAPAPGGSPRRFKRYRGLRQNVFRLAATA